MPSKKPASPRTQLRTLGFLGNISDDKGIRTFIDVCEQLQQRDASFRALIAGPCDTPDIKDYVNEAVRRIAGLEYLGPLYGADKSEFFDTIDLLLFPSEYRNEAEPLVIYEANSRAVPVLATSLGCIPEALRAGGGSVVDIAQFIPQTLQSIQDWQLSPNTFAMLSRSTLQATQNRRTLSKRALEALLAELSAPTDPSR